MDANQLRKRVEELIELEKRATGDGGDYYDYMRALHDSAPTLLPAMLAALDAVEAARPVLLGLHMQSQLEAALFSFDAAVAEARR